MSSFKAMSPEELQANAKFVRSLARCLVLEEHQAEDIAQETFVAALQHPPDSDRPIRPWLSRVVRNFAVSFFRREKRRKEREEVVLTTETVPSPDEIVEQMELRRLMIDAILGLDEPYRSTIVLHFYEDLSAADIAKNQDVPVATVRTRLRRGIERLREKLDSVHGGSRKAWILAIAPLAGLKVVPSATAAAATASTGSAVAGGLIMGTKLKVGIAAAVVVGISAALLHFGLTLLDSEPQQVGIESRPAAFSTNDQADDQQIGVEVSSALEPEFVREELASTEFFIEGQVIDKVTRQPVTAFHLYIKLREKDATGEGIIVNETFHDPEGRFHVAVGDGGHHVLRFHSSRHITAQSIKVDVPPTGRVKGLTVELDPGRSVCGKVVDDATGKPVAGVLVSYPTSTGDTVLLWFQSGFSEYHPNVITDENGYFELSGFDDYQNYVAAVHPEYAQGIADATADEVEISLKKGFRVYGKAYDDNGDPAEGILIRMSGNEHVLPSAVLTEEDGSFITPQAMPGILKLYAGNPPGMNHYNPGPWPKHPNFTHEWKLVEILDSDVEVNFGIPEEYVSWNGRLLTAQGEPVEDATVRTELEMWPQRVPSKSTETNSEGKFGFVRLLPGLYSVSASWEDGTRFYEWKKYGLAPAGTIERDLRLPPTDLRGEVVDARTGKRIVGETGLVYVWPQLQGNYDKRFRIYESGSFDLFGLEPGVYYLYAEIKNIGKSKFERVTIPAKRNDEVLRIELNPTGTVRFLLSDFDSIENQEFRMRFVSPDGSVSYGFGDTESWNSRSHRYSHVAGKWKTAFIFYDLGVVETHYEVLAGQATDVVIHRNEVKKFDESLRVTGIVKRAYGQPLNDFEMCFYPFYVSPWAEKKEWIGTKTDSEGRYVFLDLLPGEWSVSGRSAEGDWLQFDSLWVSPHQEADVVLDIVLASGAVKGFLEDAFLSQPLSENQESWSVSLICIEGGQHKFSYLRERGPCRFQIGNVPEGTYRIKVWAEGYKKYTTEAFSLEDGATVDIGRIALQPNGIVYLEVLDESDRPVTNYKVFGKAPQCLFEHGKYISEGKYRYESLPLGRLLIVVTAEGFKNHEALIDITPDGECSARIVLEKE